MKYNILPDFFQKYPFVRNPTLNGFSNMVIVLEYIALIHWYCVLVCCCYFSEGKLVNSISKSLMWLYPNNLNKSLLIPHYHYRVQIQSKLQNVGLQNSCFSLSKCLVLMLMENLWIFKGHINKRYFKKLRRSLKSSGKLTPINIIQ